MTKAIRLYDYQIKEMNNVLNRPTSIERLYESMERFAGGKKGIVYAISIDHAAEGRPKEYIGCRASEEEWIRCLRETERKRMASQADSILRDRDKRARHRHGDQGDGKQGAGEVTVEFSISISPSVGIGLKPLFLGIAVCTKMLYLCSRK